MKSLFIIMFINFSVLAVFVQSAKSQGITALIYSAPQKSEIKKFVSSELGFEIDFVGNPEITAKQFQTGTVTKFSTKRSGSNAVVKVYNMNSQNGGKLTVDKIYQLFKDDYLAFPSAILIKENDFKFETFSGKEFLVEAGIEFYKFRVLVKENLVYEVYISATNWQILNDSKLDAKNDFEKETVRFFNSFKFKEK
jgi:hypothetical protein